MSQNMETSNVMLDGFKWTLVLAIVAGSIFANMHYSSEISMVIKALAWIASIGSVFALALTTKQGRIVSTYLVEARNELRRVIWPTRDETVRMTMLVVAMVVVMGIILWTFDVVLLKVVGWLTGYGATH